MRTRTIALLVALALPCAAQAACDDPGAELCSAITLHYPDGTRATFNGAWSAASVDAGAGGDRFVNFYADGGPVVEGDAPTLGTRHPPALRTGVAVTIVVEGTPTVDAVCDLTAIAYLGGHGHLDLRCP